MLNDIGADVATTGINVMTIPVSFNENQFTDVRIDVS